MTKFTNPTDFYKQVTSFYSSLPKTAAEGKEVLEKLQAVAKTESANVQSLIDWCSNASKSKTPIKDFSTASKKTAELIKTATFASIVAMPGALFVLPLIVEKAKELNIDIVPASVAAEFSI